MFNSVFQFQHCCIVRHFPGLSKQLLPDFPFYNQDCCHTHTYIYIYITIGAVYNQVPYCINFSSNQSCQTSLTLNFVYIFLCRVLYIYASLSTCQPLNAKSVSCDFLTCRLDSSRLQNVVACMYIYKLFMIYILNKSIML